MTYMTSLRWLRTSILHVQRKNARVKVFEPFFLQWKVNLKHVKGLGLLLHVVHVACRVVGFMFLMSRCSRGHSRLRYSFWVSNGKRTFLDNFTCLVCLDLYCEAYFGSYLHFILHIEYTNKVNLEGIGSSKISFWLSKEKKSLSHVSQKWYLNREWTQSSVYKEYDRI